MAQNEALFDLQDVIAILRRATLEARQLDAVTIPVETDRKLRRGDPAVAQASRDLQHITHLCRLALTETERIYWASRGYKDPLAQ